YQVECVKPKSGELELLYRNSVEFVENSILHNPSNEFKKGNRVRLLVNFDCHGSKNQGKVVPREATGTVEWLGIEEFGVKFDQLEECEWVKDYYLEKLDKNTASQLDFSTDSD
ncbi:MAG: hypothetical protein MHMPM18_004191, partial [Marteilia pararefringens]